MDLQKNNITIRHYIDSYRIYFLSYPSVHLRKVVIVFSINSGKNKKILHRCMHPYQFRNDEYLTNV